MGIQLKDVSKSTIALTVLLILVLVGAISYKIIDNQVNYIRVKEYHVYDVKTPYGNLHKEIKTEKKFVAGIEMSEAYLTPPESMKEK